MQYNAGTPLIEQEKVIEIMLMYTEKIHKMNYTLPMSDAHPISTLCKIFLHSILRVLHFLLHYTIYVGQEKKSFFFLQLKFFFFVFNAKRVYKQIQSRYGRTQEKGRALMTYRGHQLVDRCLDFTSFTLENKDF